MTSDASRQIKSMVIHVSPVVLSGLTHVYYSSIVIPGITHFYREIKYVTDDILATFVLFSNSFSVNFNTHFLSGMHAIHDRTSLPIKF